MTKYLRQHVTLILNAGIIYMYLNLFFIEDTCVIMIYFILRSSILTMSKLVDEDQLINLALPDEVNLLRFSKKIWKLAK